MVVVRSYVYIITIYKYITDPEDPELNGNFNRLSFIQGNKCESIELKQLATVCSYACIK